MVRFVVLFVIVASSLFAATESALADDAGCSRSVVLVGCPDVQPGVGSNAVTLVGQEGALGTTSYLGAAAVGGAVSGAATVPPSPSFRKVCLRDPAACDQQPASESTQPVTVRDIATFRPTPGRQQMEPDGWTVAGLDTNFYAITDQHVVPGTLLGRPADVRFTPVSYQWAYGDGTAATKSTKGGTWAAQGIPEFDPTPTSHVYEQLGDYTITLSITFAAEYRFAGSGWRPVVGTITLPANDLYIRVGTAQTVLVEHDCVQNPSGPGC